MRLIAGMLALSMTGFPVGAIAADGFAALTGEEIRQQLTDARVDFTGKHAGIHQTFHADGRTIYVSDRPSAGRWFVQEDRYCSTWEPNPSIACYVIETDGANIRFQGAHGDVYQGVLQQGLK